MRGERTRNEQAAEFGVHPVQITQWKKVALEESPKIFSSRRSGKHKEDEVLKAALYQQVGQFKAELDWLKKSWPNPSRRSRCCLTLGILS